MCTIVYGVSGSNKGLRCMTNGLLLVFIKNPVLGRVKTRLAATVGDELALEIYLKLLHHTRDITEELPVDKAVFYSDFVDENDSWDNSTYLKKVQSGGDLGLRMKEAFQWGFQRGYKEICIIGSDCYELTPEIIMTAFQVFKIKDVVFGPSNDGGYYLLGLKELRDELFQNKKWSTDSVAADTLNDLKKLGLNYQTLEPLNDVDTEEDLPEAVK